MKTRHLLGLTLSMAALIGPLGDITAAEAATVDIAGVSTAVTVTADLGGLGLSAQPFGTATANGATFTFPITGGSVSEGGALIEHQGSGVTLSSVAATATVGNFLIDTALSLVSGDVIGGSSGVTFFIFGSGDALPGVELLISSDLATVLTQTFNAPDLAGATFGYAVPDVSLVPVPAAGLLLVSALGAFAVTRRRRREPLAA